MRRAVLLLCLLLPLAACGDGESVRPGSTMPTCYYAAGGPDAAMPSSLEECQELNRAAQPGASPAPAGLDGAGIPPLDGCAPPSDFQPGGSYWCRPSPAPSTTSPTPR